MACLTSLRVFLDESRDKRFILIGDSDHTSADIPTFTAENLVGMNVQHLMLEIVSDKEVEILGAAKRGQDVSDLLHGFTQQPSAMNDLIHAALDRGVRVHFIDNRHNAEAVRELAQQAIQAASDGDLERFNQLNDDAFQLRFSHSYHQSVADRIRSLGGDERSLILFGSGHLIGLEDIDELLGDDAISLGLYHNNHHLNSVLEAFSAMNFTVEDQEHCLLLSTPGPSIATHNRDDERQR